jgi:hypothetical protein
VRKAPDAIAFRVEQQPDAVFQRLKRLPPGLYQVEVGGVLRLEDELPARVGHVEQQHVVGLVGSEVVRDGVDPPHPFGHPRLDLLQEIHERQDRAGLVGFGERLAGGGYERPEDVTPGFSVAVES